MHVTRVVVSPWRTYVGCVMGERTGAVGSRNSSSNSSSISSSVLRTLERGEPHAVGACMEKGKNGGPLSKMGASSSSSSSSSSS
eukprot:8633677-Heterocapsa_arctica.AAC.1